MPGAASGRSLENTTAPIGRSELASYYKSETDRRQWKHELQGHIPQSHRAITFIPSGRPLVLGIDDEQNTPRFGRHTQAPFSCRQQKLAAETPPLHVLVRCDPGEQEAANIVLREALGNRRRQAAKANRDGSQTVETKHPLGIGIVDRTEGFRAACLVVLARVFLEERVKIGITAIETLPIMRFRDRLFMPFGYTHTDRGNAATAARSLSFGVGGFSSRSITRE